MSIAHRAQSGRAPVADRGDDLYETPPSATRALMAVESLPHYLWEPAAGRGAIVRGLRSAGHEVIASDLIDYGQPYFAGRNFLLERTAPDKCEAIITNPPYKLADRFVAHAITLCPKVIMLLRMAFLESTRRSAILDGGTLARIHVFRNRLPMMHRGGWAGNKASSSIPFAWFVWDATHRGPAVVDRVSWDRAPNEAAK